MDLLNCVIYNFQVSNKIIPLGKFVFRNDMAKTLLCFHNNCINKFTF